MKGNTIVLADSSYTIRRIVELSFSEIENVEIFSAESGQGLKEKLLEMLPRVVIVDVKLPVVNGYEICQFINQTPQLNKTHVFLMKGSFEPINQELIKSLTYEEIITKPFDSNLLVAAVMKILEEEGGVAAAGEESPPSVPEEAASIDTEQGVEEEINFSDIRDEILTSPQTLPAEPPASPPSAYPDDEIEPSEEITQQQMPKDKLAPEEKIVEDEGIPNPFDSEAAQADAGVPETPDFPPPVPDMMQQPEPPEMPPPVMEEPPAPEPEAEPEPAPPPAPPQFEAEPPAAPPSILDEMEADQFPDFPAEPPAVNIPNLEEETVEPAASPEVDLPEVSEEQEPEVALEDTSEAISASSIDDSPSDSEEPYPIDVETVESTDMSIEFQEEGEKVEMEAPTFSIKEPDATLPEESSTPSTFDQASPETGEMEMDTEGQFFPGEESEIETEPQPEQEPPAAPPAPEPEFEKKEEPPIAASVARELEGKMDEQLTSTIREVLWEIVPKMAEKIIREEIDKIKADLNNPES